MDQANANNNLTTLSLRLARWLALGIAVPPLLTAIGYAFDISYLTGAIGSYPAMRPSTAVGLIFVALSIFLTSYRKSSKILILLSSIFCVILGSFTLAGHFLPFPGSPSSPQAALNFVLIGISIFIYNFIPPLIRFAQLLTFFSAFNAEIALTGYIFNATEVYGFPMGMSIQAAACFIISTVALICSRPEAGLTKLLFREKSHSGAVARKLFLTIIFGPMVIGLFTRLGLFFGLYAESAHDALFVLILIAVIIRQTWQSAKLSEIEELRAEKALEEKQLFFTFIENSLDFIGMTDADYKPKYVNPAGRKMVGIPLDFPIETALKENFYPPDTRAFIANVVNRSVRESGFWHGETNFRHWKNDRKVPVWISNFLIRDIENKKILGSGIIGRDITDRKLLEDELHFSEARSSGIISISADAIISIDRNQNIILFNEGAEKIFGYSKAEMLGQKLDCLIPDRFRTRHHQHVSNFASGESVARRMGERGATIYGRRKNGEEFPADAAISKIAIGGSQIMTVTLRDITERVRIEKSQRFLTEVATTLAEGGLILEVTVQKLAELMVKNMADMCILKTLSDDSCESFKILSKNPADAAKCAELLNLINTSPSAFSQIMLKTRYPLLIENVSEAHLSLLSINEKQLTALQNLNLASMLSVPLIAHQKFIGTLVLISNNMNNQFHEADLHLAEEVALRAALSFENSSLYHESQKAITSREEILAVVSHDLKSPLTTIKLIGETLHLLEAPDKQTCENLAKKIGNSTRQMQVLIGDLLDFAKMQSGTFSVVQTAETLFDATREIIESLQALAQAKQQRLIMDFAKDLPKVSVDLPRITQVISNLLGNALKFTPIGGTIKISALARKFDVLVSVSDTGSGIAPEDLTKIFDRFWQAESTKHKGSGLGLSIAKGIIQAHGGKIWAESELQKGTTFHFTVPIDDVKAVGKVNISSAKAVDAFDPSAKALKGARILVVDDSPDSLFLIKHLLESLGAEVTVADNVKTALSSIKFSLPNVLFTDIEMPEESGYDLLSQLRKSSDSKNKAIPVIALTGHDENQEIEKIKAAGFDLYLSKPINLEKMVSAILQFTQH